MPKASKGTLEAIGKTIKRGGRAVMNTVVGEVNQAAKDVAKSTTKKTGKMTIATYDRKGATNAAARTKAETSRQKNKAIGAAQKRTAVRVAKVGVGVAGTAGVSNVAKKKKAKKSA